MTRKERLAARRELEEYYYNCKLETPEEVARQFEVYTKLIWYFHQAGLCYDYYCDTTVTRLEGVGQWVGGHDALEVETLPTFSLYPQNTMTFKTIYAVGDPENGYHFGQVTTNGGTASRTGANDQGMGDGSTFEEDEEFTLCECYVNKVDGRWVITDEWVVSGEEARRRRMTGARPFCRTILDAYPREDQLEKFSLEDMQREMEEAAAAR